jgi:hypothetical protein
MLVGVSLGFISLGLTCFSTTMLDKQIVSFIHAIFSAVKDSVVAFNGVYVVAFNSVLISGF